MKLLSSSIALLLVFLAVGCTSENQNKAPELTGPYLGQEPPGLTPIPFASGLVTTNAFEDGGVFSHDMNEFYFVRERPQDRELETIVFTQEKGLWTKTVRAGEDAEPFYRYFAPDGKTMHFGKQYKERTSDGWSDTKSLGPDFEDINIMSLSASSQGTYVIDERRDGDDGLLRYSRLVDGVREAPEPFGSAINSGTRNSHPFIAPDESYIMWDGIKDSGFGNVDLYISFRQPDGSWGRAINMGAAINTDAYEAGPKVTPDGKYLFFVRVVGTTDDNPYSDIDIFWVDAQIIENLRPKQ
ncbi:hypothetical protein [Sphingorhabdus sp. Alg231-15]|uniref:hypothetical protein n=1 Tax=Sphingorhabdus sp. Alg231-15 TaxID=1922222 RepID=UPI00307BD664